MVGLSSTPGAEQNPTGCRDASAARVGVPGPQPEPADQHPPKSEPSAVETVTGHFPPVTGYSGSQRLPSRSVFQATNCLLSSILVTGLLSTKSASRTCTHACTGTGTEASRPQVQPLSSVDQKKSQTSMSLGGSRVVLLGAPFNPKSHLSSHSNKKYKGLGKEHVIKGLGIHYIFEDGFQ